MKKKVLLTLSKLTRQHLQSRKSALILNQMKAEALKKEIDRTEQSLQEEKEFILTHPELQGIFENYRKNTHYQQRERLQEKRKHDKELQRIQERVKRLFQEVKSYEIPYATYQKQLIKEQQALEQKTLDEIALGIFRHKRKATEDLAP